MSKTHCKARVQVTVEVDATSAWGPECTMEQVHRQAREEAVLRLQRALSEGQGFRILGDPKVAAVIGEEQ